MVGGEQLMLCRAVHWICALQCTGWRVLQRFEHHGNLHALMMVSSVPLDAVKRAAW
jgi:hypothetical protein